jgi:hypothetical protein
MEEEQKLETPSFVERHGAHLQGLYEVLIVRKTKVPEFFHASLSRLSGQRKFKLGAEQSYVGPSMYRYDSLPAPKFSYTPEDVKNVIMRLPLDDRKPNFPVIPETMRQDLLPKKEPLKKM